MIQFTQWFEIKNKERGANARQPITVLAIGTQTIVCAVSNTDLPSEAVDHRGEGAELAGEEGFMKPGQRGDEGCFQFRCSQLRVSSHLKGIMFCFMMQK